MKTQQYMLKHRVFQYIGIMLIAGVFGVAYWYFSVRAGFNASSSEQEKLNTGLTSGLVGYWPFDGNDVSGTTAYDRSGQSNNASVYALSAGFYDEFATTESWSEYLMTGSVVSGEYNGAITNTSDPQMYRSVTSFSPTNNILQIRYKGYATNGPTNMNLFYVDGTDCAGYSATCQQNFSITSDGTWKIINVSITDAEWADDSNITSIRLDPEGQTATGTFYIDYIRFYSNSAASALAAAKSGQGLTNASAVNNYATVADSASLDITSAITLSVWAKANSFKAASPYISGLISKAHVTGSTGFSLRFGDAALNANQPQFGLNIGGTNRNINGPQLTNKDWYLITGTYDGSTMRLYVNGIEVSNASYTGSIATNNELLVFGDDYILDATQDRSFDGRLDEVRIYNRALSVAEITQLYQSGSADKINAVGARSDALTAGLTGYWRLDEGSGTTTADSSGNGNTLSFGDAPAWTTGKFGNGVDFDGVNDYLATTTLPSTGSTYLTMSVWTYWQQTSSTTQIIVWNGTAATNGYGLLIGNGSGGTGNVVTVALGGVSYNVTGSAQVLPSNEWAHLVMTRDGSVWRLYLNGVPVSGTGTTNANAPTSSFSAGGYFDGKLDDIRFYKRPLSASEVAELYRETNPENPDANLVGYWSLDGQDTYGMTTLDRSIKGNAGTLTNTAPTLSAGAVNQSLFSDGTGNNVLNTNFTRSWGASESFSFSMWFKSNVTSNSSDRTLFGVGDTINGTEIALEVDGDATLCADETLAFFVDDGPAGADTLCSGYAINNTDWHHAVAVYDDSAGQLRISIDGTQIAVASTTTNSSDAKTITYSIGVGGYNGNNVFSQYFSGNLDEFRIYSKALSASEIQTLYENSRERKDHLNAADLQKDSLTRGLAGYWRLDDGSGTNATDSSINGNTGTLTNGPTWTTGQVSGAVNFDGANDFVNVPDSDPLSITGDMTVAAWINPTDFANTNGIVGKTNGSIPAPYDFYLVSSTGKPRLFRGNGSLSYANVDATNAPATGQWQFVAVTMSGNKAKHYLNGFPNGEGTLSATLSDAGTALRIGSRNDSGTPFKGKIDEVRIYSRSLAAEEIYELYRLTAPKDAYEPGLVGYWSFNGPDISGTSAADGSGKSNQGTLTNGPVVTSGKSGQGLSFDGSNDHVSVPNNAAFDFGASQDFTVSAWVRTTQGMTASMYYGIVSKDDGIASRQGYNIFLHNSNLDARWFFEFLVGGTQYGAYGTSDIADGNWHHLVGMRSGSTLLTYQDGVLANTLSSVSTGSVSKAVSLNIGGWGGTSNYFNGKIDEVRIYNRALSADEVKSLYDRAR